MNTLKQVALVKKLIKKRANLWEKQRELSEQVRSFDRSLDINKSEIKTLLRVHLSELFGENEIKNFATDLWGGAGPDCMAGRLATA